MNKCFLLPFIYNPIENLALNVELKNRMFKAINPACTVITKFHQFMIILKFSVHISQYFVQMC